MHTHEWVYRQLLETMVCEKCEVSIEVELRKANSECGELQTIIAELETSYAAMRWKLDYALVELRRVSHDSGWAKRIDREYLEAQAKNSAGLFSKLKTCKANSLDKQPKSTNM